jgi:anti-sigma B factor antagonist
MHEGDWTVLRVQGEIDLSNASVLRRRIMDEIRRGHLSIAVDLSELDFLDASGLAVLIAGRRMTEEVSGSLTLITPSPQVRKVLQVSGLDKVFAMSGTPNLVNDPSKTVTYPKRSFKAFPATDQPDFA